MGAARQNAIAQYEPITIAASDGYVLGGRLYAGPAFAKPETVALVNAGAGLRQSYYAAFASYLANAGIPTLTYDYRGIGGSRPASLRRFQATVEEWGSKDCAPVVNWMKTRFPEAKLSVVGHSVGALVTGFVTNGRDIDTMLWIGGHTGYWRDYTTALKPAMFLAWHVVAPAVSRLLGYFPGRVLGLGEDLPHGVTVQWAQRRRPELWWNVKDAHGAPDLARIDELRARFAAIHARALALRFADDAFATDLATRRLASLYVNANVETECIAPSDIRLRKAGHFAFFRPEQGSALWPRALRFLANGTR